MIPEIFLMLLAVYLAAGLLVAVPFVIIGVQRIDPQAAHGTWGFRCLILPGVTAFWPWLLWRWIKGIHEPPGENNAHRCAARNARPESRLPRTP